MLLLVYSAGLCSKCTHTLHSFEWRYLIGWARFELPLCFETRSSCFSTRLFSQTPRGKTEEGGSHSRGLLLVHVFSLDSTW